MQIVRISPDTYGENYDLAEKTRQYRQSHLWPIETDRCLLEEYRLTDRTKFTFVAVDDKGEFAGGEKKCRTSWG